MFPIRIWFKEIGNSYITSYVVNENVLYKELLYSNAIR